VDATASRDSKRLIIGAPYEIEPVFQFFNQVMACRLLFISDCFRKATRGGAWNCLLRHSFETKHF
jgi:hypothetical protein